MALFGNKKTEDTPVKKTAPKKVAPKKEEAANKKLFIPNNPKPASFI